MKTVKKLSLTVLVLTLVLCLASCMDVNIKANNSTQNNGAAGNNYGNSGTQNNNSNNNTPTENYPVETRPSENVSENSSGNGNTETPTENSNKVPTQMTKQELLEFFNSVLNDVKISFPGFKRAKLTTVSDIVLSNKAANTLVSFVKGALLSEEVEEKTAQKGSSNMELMSPDGERFVSQLLYGDIKDITLSNDGSNYVITVYLPDATNPTKDVGAYAKVFNFITVNDVVNVYAPKVGATVARSNIQVKYSGCYAKAVITPDGKLVSYETYVTCVMSLKDASVKKVVTINTDVDITLESTTKYTDFVY